MNAPVTPTTPSTPSTPESTPKPTIGPAPLATPTIKPLLGSGTSANGQQKPSLSPSGAKPTMMKGKPPFTMGTPKTEVSKWLKLLVYARPGGGKTTLLASAADVPQMQDILYIDAEKGNLVVSDNQRIKNPDNVLRNRIAVNDFKTVAMVHDFLKGHCLHRDTNNVEKLRETEAWLRGCDPDDIEEPARFRTVLIDSMTEVDIYCTYGLLGLSQDKVIHGEAGDIDVARFDEFRKNNQMMQMLCRAFRDLPIHVLAAAHETYSEDELRKKNYMPQLTGQLRNQVPGFFDIVGYLTFQKEGENIVRKMMVQPTGPWTAKNRRSVYKSDHFKDPTMLDIMRGCKLLVDELQPENTK